MAGQYFDAETGLHYNYHRYYDPSIGRYLRPDPLGLASGINAYTYTSNNPINLNDPLGLIEWTGTVRGATLLTAGIYVYELESECVKGKQAKVKVVFAGPGIGFGLDLSATKSDVKLKDPFEYINPFAFDGDAYIAQAGLSWPPTSEQKLGQMLAGEEDLPHGGSYSSIRLGNVAGQGYSDLYGINISLEALYGSSSVWSSEIVECCNER